MKKRAPKTFFSDFRLLFDVIFGALFGHFGDIMVAYFWEGLRGRFWTTFGSILESFWTNFEVILGSFFEILFGFFLVLWCCWFLFLVGAAWLLFVVGWVGEGREDKRRECSCARDSV